MRDAGLGLTRSFCFWPDFQAQPGTVSPVMLRRLREFLDIHQDLGLMTIPTFVVGHMSGANWDPPVRDGRDLYQDGWLLAQQALYVRHVVQSCADHPAVAAWLLSNEMPLYGGSTTRQAAWAWTEVLTQAVRAAGGRQPVSTGDGAWGVEVTGVDNGFSLRDLGGIVDFVGPHVYPMGDDPARHLLHAAFHCELAQVAHRPVVLEEFGVPDAFASEANAAAWYRQVLHSSLLAGASGWLAWNNTDFRLTAEDPYRHHPFEMGFGLTKADGKPKAPLGELSGFRTMLDAIELPRCTRQPTDVGLIVSSFLEVPYPFWGASAAPHPETDERAALRAALHQAYVSLRQAGLAPAILRERDGIPDAGLLVLPSTQALTAEGWEALERTAARGALVYVSYTSGVSGFQRGLWHHRLNDFFGVVHTLRYGLLERVGDVVTWTFVHDLGTLDKGVQLRFPVAGSHHARAFLPVEPRESEVVAVDAEDRPALLRRPVGDAAIVLATTPIEYFAAQRWNERPDDAWRLYRALATEANAAPAYHTGNPAVITDVLLRDDGVRFQWLISHANEPVEIRGDEKWTALDGEPKQAVRLDPFGVAVLATA